jgi:hypothetical protein
MKNVIKSLISIALFGVFTTALAPAAAANDSSRIIPGVELKLLGDMKDQTVFEMTLTSAEEEEFTIVIRDLQGNLLFKDKLTGTNITRKFRLENIDEFENGSLLVEVKTKRSNKSEQYKINKNTRLIQETVITKLK